jgi:hypothetical protein
MLKVGLIEYEGRVFDLRQFEHQLIVLIEEFDRIVSPDGFGERYMDISIFPCINISRNLIYFQGHKRFYEEGITIDKNEGILCPAEDGVAEGL